MRSLALRANASAAPAVRPAALRGAPEEVKGDTSVVSTASCEPPQSASPLAMTSMRRSSLAGDINVEIPKPDVEGDRGSGLPAIAGGRALERPAPGTEDA